MVSYIKSDLEFILDQIKLSEAHAGGAPLFGPGGLIPAYNIAWGLRTVDGTYNNLLYPELGASDNPFPEGLGTIYRPADGGNLDPDGPGPAPSFPTQANYNPSNNPNSVVIDSSLRTISNLIVDQTLANPSAIMTALQRGGIVADSDLMARTAEISAAFAPIESLFDNLTAAEVLAAEAATAAAANPGDAALAAAAADAEAARAAAEADLTAARSALDTLLADNGVTLEGANIVIGNVAPDEGLSAPFNSWFTLFGQFFDHGLDLVGKGGSGTVFVPLQPDDPLYDPTSPTNFMVLTRATVTPGADGIMGTADDVRPINTTTAFVDQNQTYTSHASHQVFVRAYQMNADGEPVATGKLIEGGNGGMATWGDVKAQALTMLGIQLVDSDVGNVPLLATDQYGEFIRGPNGFPQIVFPGANPGDPNILVEGNPAANGGEGVLVDGAYLTGHAFLADIAHNAVPDGLADGDIEIGLGNGDGSTTDNNYDNELLDAHYIAGDGRANENIGLTAVHHVFHSEHNRLVEHTKAVVLATNDTAFIQQWLVADADISNGVQDLEWDGERLFQAAKFGTEMQYQHLVFEEFARKIQPNINVFLVPDGYDVTLDPSIVAEFAHVVYRFGHSMLTESIDRFDPSFNEDHIGLIEGFLNPIQFENNGGDSVVDAGISAGAIIRGMTRQAGNDIDEFVTSALRNNLLGLPLDLATINLARGRDTGVPSLNEARRQFYEATAQDSLLRPYESWVDFAGFLKHEASIINFVAAYGNHALITDQTTIEGKRNAALTIISGISVGGLDVPADAVDFLNGTGDYGAANALGGLDDVDLWIGGLAEQIMPFGGMLGSTFNFVFETQMENLQSGDRFYYLQRLDGLHLFGEMENNSFAAMIMRNTDATHLPSDVFSTPGLILEIDRTRQYNPGLGETAGADGILVDDPDTVADESADNLGIDPVGSGILTQLVIRNNPATPGADSNYLRYTGGEHVVLGGTGGNDILIAGIGDDTLYGDAGNDKLEGGFGNDILNGGDGDDIITDTGGDDNIKAGTGNDVVHAGPGLDLVMGNDGQDFIFLGTDMGSEVFAGTGNDFIYGNKNAERILGNEGHDWIETGTFDGAPGDNFDEIFAHDSVDGHDVFLGDGGFDEFIGEGGDDIFVGSAGRGKMAGMSGFDWVTYKDNISGVNADLSIPIVFDESPTLPQNASLDEFESVEGLSGSRFNDVLIGTNDVNADRAPTSQGGTTGFLGSALDAQGIAMISGLQALGPGVSFFTGGDIILAGDGSDVITGQMGNDLIDGDRWLDVQIGVFAPGDVNHTGPASELHNSMTTLAARMFSGEINPGRLSIVRTIRSADGAGDTDVAVFSDIRANYTVSTDVTGTVTVTHVTVSDGLESDGTDWLRNIERLRFADVEIAMNTVATGQPTLSDVTPTEGRPITVSLAGVVDQEGVPAAFTVQWQELTGGVWTAIAGATAAAYTPNQARVGLSLRAVVNFVDLAGYSEQVISAPTDPVGDLITGTNAGATHNGTPWADEILGLGGNDILNGLAGDDVLNGGTGNDTMNGGTGNDIYVVDAAGDTVNEGANAGTDTVQTTVTHSLGANVENLVDTGAANINLTGNGLNNVITGGGGNNVINGGGGNDTLSGLGGNDTLNGGTGADSMDGGTGNDIYVVDNAGDVVTELANAGTDTVQSNITHTLSANVENLVLTGVGAINGTGNALANRIETNDGQNVLTGGAGADVFAFFGGTTADPTISTGATAATRDRITDGQGNDRIDLSAIDASRTGGADNNDNDAFSGITFGTVFAANSPGQLLYRHETIGGVGYTIVEGNTDNDIQAEFQIELVGTFTLVNSNFIL